MTVAFEAAGGDFDLGRRRRPRQPARGGSRLAEDGQQLFMDLRLFVINVYAVVGHVDARGRAVALGIDVLVEGVEGGQASGARLAAVFLREQDGEVGTLDLAGVLAGAREGVLQSDGGRGDAGRCLRTGHCG